MKSLQTKRYGKSAFVNLHACYMATLGKKVVIYTSSSDRRKQVEDEIKLYNPDFISKGLITVKTTKKGIQTERRNVMTQMMICPKADECDHYCNTHSTPHDETEACVDFSRKTYVSSRCCPPCTPYVKEFKVGDRVRVLGKTCDETTSVVNVPLEETMIEKGGIYIVGGVRKDRGYAVYSLKVDMGRDFAQQDLELITEETMEKKYQSTNKTRNIANFYYEVAKDGCLSTFVHLQSLMYDLKPETALEIINEKDLITWAEQDPKRIKWLIEKGYIELVQNEYDKWVDGCPDKKGYRINRQIISELIDWAKRMPRD